MKTTAPIIITLDLYVTSVANWRVHWGTRARRAKSHRTAAHLECLAAFGRKPSPLPCTVTLTRIAPAHRQADDDNNVAAMKGLRDGVADALNVKDNDPRVKWSYGQRVGKGAVEIRIERIGP